MTALEDRIAQAIGDPGSIVGRKFGPSWGAGKNGYSPREETVIRWSTRAVMAVLAERDRNLAAALRREAHEIDVDLRDVMDGTAVIDATARAEALRARADQLDGSGS